MGNIKATFCIIHYSTNKHFPYVLGDVSGSGDTGITGSVIVSSLRTLVF